MTNEQCLSHLLAKPNCASGVAEIYSLKNHFHLMAWCLSAQKYVVSGLGHEVTEFLFCLYKA